MAEKREPSNHESTGEREPNKVGSLCVCGVLKEKTNSGTDQQSKLSEKKINELCDSKTHDIPSYINVNIHKAHLNTKKRNCEMGEGINKVNKDTNGIYSGTTKQLDQTCAVKSSSAAQRLEDKDAAEFISHYTRPGYITKPKFRPPCQSRRRKLAMIEPQLKINTHELVEIQEIRIEKGTIQIVNDEGKSSSEPMKNNRMPQIKEISNNRDHSRPATDNSSVHPNGVLQQNEERKKSDPGPPQFNDCDLCLIEQHNSQRPQSSAGENHDRFDEDFLPRLRSRSMDESREREKVIKENKIKKNNSWRRKSFEVWLTDKEKQIIKDMNIKAFKKKQEVEEEAKRKHQHRGKSYEEWLEEKYREETKKHAWIEHRDQEQHEAEQRRRMSQDRYDKWLFEKEIRALRKEQDKLKEVERKATEMRKKCIERNSMASSKNPVVL